MSWEVQVTTSGLLVIALLKDSKAHNADGSNSFHELGDSDLS